MANGPCFISTVFALHKLGATAALLNSVIRGDALVHCVQVGKMRMVICGRDQDLVAAMVEIMPRLHADGVKLFLSRQAEDATLPDGFLPVDLTSAFASADTVPRDVRKDSSFSDAAFFFYTSGTTGMPKAARLEHKRVLIGAHLLQLFHLSASDVMYIPLPLFHTAGMVLGVCGVAIAGATLVTRPKFSASSFWDDVRRHRVTIIQYIGETCRYLLNQPKMDSDGVYDQPVKLAIGNGLSPDIWIEFKERFKILQIGEIFAASEGNRAFINTDGTVGAVGCYSPIVKWLLDDVEIIECDWETAQPIRGRDGKCILLPKGQTGLMVCKVTKMATFEGYVSGKEATEKKIVRNVRTAGDEYFNTGDLLMIRKDNYVFFKDRLGDTFRWKGENVAASEVASVLTKLPFISEAIVYGVAIPGYDGRAGMAAIVFYDDVGPEAAWEEIYAHVTRHLPPYARPKFVRTRGQMQTTITHKYSKLELNRDGFRPKACGTDRLYFVDNANKTYVPLGQDLYDKILTSEIRL